MKECYISGAGSPLPCPRSCSNATEPQSSSPMRLLNVHDITFRAFHGQDIPRYVTASHRWGEGTEATIKDVQKKRRTDKMGYKKVQGFTEYVKKFIPHVEWVWIDTCCINQESDREVSEAVNSMFRWYRDAEVCLAYLKDVEEPQDFEAFSQSEWFRRGWTLQELIAPRTVIFLTRTWEVIGHKAGSEYSQSNIQLRVGPPMEAIVAQTTGIPTYVLQDYTQSQALTVEQRLHWTNGRKTTCEEDMSYCLLGLFDITMPVIYGEGSAKARKRLLEEIYRNETLDVERESASGKMQIHETANVEADEGNLSAVTALAAWTCSAFAELRKVCQTLPGRLHALNNEVTDLAIVLDELSNSSGASDLLSTGTSQPSDVQTILGTLTDRLADVKSTVEAITLACSHTRTPLVQAKSWSKVQGKLRSLQEDIRIHKAQLNVVVSSSKSQTLPHIRLNIDAVSTNPAVGAQLQKFTLDELKASMTNNHADMTDMLSHAFQRVDERIASLDHLMRVQETRFYHDHEKPQSSKSAHVQPTDWLVLTQAEKKAQMPARTDAVGFRTHRYTATCRPGCSCACHKQRRASTPAIIDRVVGQLFVGYSGLPLLGATCSDRRCKRKQAAQVDLEYWFPFGYFWSLILQAQFTYQSSLGPKLSLTTIRRVPDGAQSVEFALAGNIPGLKYLFERGLASPRDVSATRGYSLLRWAMYSNQYEAAKFLYHEGADAEYGPAEMAHDLCYSTPRGRANALLLEEGTSSHEDALRLIGQGGDWKDDQEYTLLHKAVIGLTSISIEEAIFQHPYDLDTPDASGRTPLSWAAIRGDARAIGILLAHGADPNVFEVHGNGILYNATDRKGSALCCRLLLEAGANPNPGRAKGIKCNSPLSNAVQMQWSPLISKTLLDFGADVDSCGPDGKTPLIVVSRTDNLGTAQLLLEYGANINATSVTEDTPLTTAIKHNSHNVLRLLLGRWFEYSECPRLKAPHLLNIVASYADAETMSILRATDHLRLMHDKNYGNARESFAQRLVQRFDASDELNMLFDDLLAVIETTPNERRDSAGFFGSFLTGKGVSNAPLAADVEKANSVDHEHEDDEFEDALEQLEFGLGATKLEAGHNY